MKLYPPGVFSEATILILSEEGKWDSIHNLGALSNIVATQKHWGNMEASAAIWKISEDCLIWCFDGGVLFTSSGWSFYDPYKW